MTENVRPLASEIAIAGRIHDAAETLLSRVDRLFNLTYNAYVDYRAYRTDEVVSRYLSLVQAWQLMTGLSADSAERRMQETYTGRNGALIAWF